MSKPKFKSSSRVEKLKSDVKPSFAAPGSSTPIEYETIGWGPIILGWVKGIIGFVALALALVIMAYLGLSSTVAYIVTVDDTKNIVARNTFIGGEAKKDAIIYASTSTPVVDEMTSKTMQGITGLLTGSSTDDAVVVKVIAGPTNSVQAVDGSITISNKKGDPVILTETVEGVTAETKFLKNEYVVECVTGECEKGAMFLIPAKNISGELLNMNGKRLSE